MRYKLLVLDVDGTIVINKFYPISKNVASYLKRAKEKIKIVLCTGRTKDDLANVIRAIVLQNSYYIVEGGAKVIDPQGKYEYMKTISFKATQEIIKKADYTFYDISYCVDGSWVTDEKKAQKGNITNVSLNSTNPIQTRKILEKVSILSAKYHVAVGTHIKIIGGAHVMISHKQANKGFGIRYVQNKLGISRKETVGVGDMLNDLPIFKESGLRIAMGNADDKLKNRADFVAPTVEKEGLVDVIKKFVLS